LVVDSAGNIATASPDYSLTQDVASAVRTFKGELYYNVDYGIPYFDDVLGYLPPPSLLMGLFEKVAKTVYGVIDAQCVISTFNERGVTGSILFVDESGAQGVVNF
jgi:hypothetical protein